MSENDEIVDVLNSAILDSEDKITPETKVALLRMALAGALLKANSTMLEIQSYTAEEYHALMQELTQRCGQIFEHVDYNTLRWQGVDVVMTPVYASMVTFVLKIFSRSQSSDSLLGQPHDWWEKNYTYISSFITLSCLTMYESFQSVMPGRSFDFKDIAAYIAGISLYVGSNKGFEMLYSYIDEDEGDNESFLQRQKDNVTRSLQRAFTNAQDRLDDASQIRGGNFTALSFSLLEQFVRDDS